MPIKERLQVVLHPGWVPEENPGGPVTFMKTGSQNPLQISYALCKKGQSPDFSKENLLEMARGLLKAQGAGEAILEETGECSFGFYATIACKLDKMERFQIWHLSNGKDLINVTYICDKEPCAEEVKEAKDITMSLYFKYEKKTWWSFGN